VRSWRSTPPAASRWTDSGLSWCSPLDLRTVDALLVDDLGARLRDDVLALLKGHAAVLQLDDLGLALGPPLDDAGALDERVLEDGVEVQEAGVVVLPNVADVVLGLLGHGNIGFSSRGEEAGMLRAREQAYKARQHRQDKIADLGEDNRRAARISSFR